MILSAIRFLSERITNVLTHLVQSVLWCTILISIAYSFGWIQRLLWLTLEQTASSLWNGTPVTIGSLEIDLIRGRIWATNVVIHTPKRNEWQWTSPIICRIGRVYVEHNWVSSMVSMIFRMVCGQGQKQILELYTVEISDVQGFIERKQHIFNFYLMDSLYELPDPQKILEEEVEAQKLKLQKQRKDLQQGQSATINSQQDCNTSDVSVDWNLDADPSEATFAQSRNSNILDDGKDNMIGEEIEDDAMARRQAQQLVDDMFSAVKSIGRAARQKGSLTSALVEQRAQLTSKLKQFKGAKNKTEAMQEGVKVIRRVGKVVAKKTKDIQNVMPKVPPRKEVEDVPVYARVGRVIIEDARVFTRTNLTTDDDAIDDQSSVGGATTASTGGSEGGLSSHQLPQQATGAPIANIGLGAKWNKPIGISEIVLRSSELCPPSSLLDENGLPEIYQPLDDLLDVVLKRVLVGLAKNNTSRFLQTALGELLELEYSAIFGDHDASAANPLAEATQSKQSPYRRSASVVSEPLM